MVFTDAIIDTKKKVNLLGDTSVGKTSLILRYVKSLFGDQYLKTIGTNVYTKDVEIPGAKVKLIINDIMGEKAYRSVQQGAFMGSTGIIAVADVTRKESLDNLVDYWLPLYYEIADEDNPVVLAVNKDDLDDKEITEEVLKEYSSYFPKYFFTSAKECRNVEVCFEMLAELVVPNLQIQIEDIEDVIHSKKIDNIKEMIDALLAYASELGDMPYEEREWLLEESGIDKFTLDQKDDLDLEIYGSITEEQTLTFADKIKGWYEEHDDDYSAQAVEELVKKYKADSSKD